MVNKKHQKRRNPRSGFGHSSRGEFCRYCILAGLNADAESKNPLVFRHTVWPLPQDLYGLTLDINIWTRDSRIIILVEGARAFAS